jgi:hypothetical protein
MKVNSRIYKGIHYVQLTDLPVAQQERLVETVNSSLFIKILIDKHIVSKCIQYKDYELWFDTIYKKQVVHANATEPQISLRLTNA